MRNRDNSRKGLAAVEFALILPAIALLFLFLVEGANAMHAYSNLVEASREGARLALLDGAPSDIEALVQAVTQELDADYLTTSVITDEGSNTVTVEVTYDYQPFGENALEALTGESSLQFVAQTTMPMP
jgi:Flp pilus assembly protein TadG